MCLNWSSVFSHVFTYSSAFTNHPNHFVISHSLITSSLTKYSCLNYGCIFLVLLTLILLPIGSSLHDCSLYLLDLIANGHHEYHKEYCWPNTFLFAHKKLSSLNLQHFLMGICPTRDYPTVTDIWIAWKQTDLLFFLKTDSGLDVLWQLPYCPHK